MAINNTTLAKDLMIKMGMANMIQITTKKLGLILKTVVMIQTVLLLKKLVEK